MRRTADTEATVRGALVGAVSFAASLTAHAVAMSGAGSASSLQDHGMTAMASHDMASMPGHDMAAMPGHAMAAMPGHDMAAMRPAVEASRAMAPGIPLTSVLLLAAVCALIGALAARPRAAGPVAAAAMVLFGQAGGHLALGVTMGHLAITPAMALAHLVAAAVAGAAIAGAESALRAALGALRPLAACATIAPRTVVARMWGFHAVPLPVLACHGALRAPPA